MSDPEKTKFHDWIKDRLKTERQAIEILECAADLNAVGGKAVEGVIDHRKENIRSLIRVRNLLELDG